MRNKSHRLLKYFILSLITLSILYAFLWFKAVNHLEQKITTMVSDLNKQGYVVCYNAVRAQGFPFSIRVDLDNFMIQLPKPLSLKGILTGPLSAYTRLFDANAITFEINNPFKILSVAQDAEKVAGLDAGIDTYIDIGTLRLTLPYLHQNHFDLILNDIVHESHQVATVNLIGDVINPQNNTYRIKIYCDNLTMNHRYSKSLLGLSHLKQVALEMMLQSPFSKAQRLPGLKDVIQILYDNESVINLDRLNIECDQFKFLASGTIAFDKKLQPLIVLSSEISNLDYFVDLMVARKIIRKSIKPFVHAGLGSLRQTAEHSSDAAVHKVSITLQDQELSLMNFPIAKFDDIKWQDL